MISMNSCQHIKAYLYSCVKQCPLAWKAVNSEKTVWPTKNADGTTVGLTAVELLHLNSYKIVSSSRRHFIHGDRH